MKRRFRSFFGAEYAEALPFRTINGVCQSIIHRYARVKGTVPVSYTPLDVYKRQL